MENAIGSAKTYTDEEIVKVKTGLTADLGEVSSQISALSKELDTFESACSATYETIENVKLISANTLTSAKTYTDGKFDEVASALTDNVGEINQKFENVQKIIHNQEQMIEILIAENQSLGGEISKDLD